MSRRIVMRALALALVLVTTSRGQQEGVSTALDYTSSVRDRMGANSTTGLGVALDVGLLSIQDVNVSFSVGFWRLSVDHPDVLQSWNPQAWSARYAGRADSLRSTTRAAQTQRALRPTQVILALPLGIEASLPLVFGDALVIEPNVGLGVYWYRRNLVFNDDWRSTFGMISGSASDFSSPKHGNPLYVSAGLQLSYPLTDWLWLRAGGGIVQLLKTKALPGYDDLPFETALNTRVGVEAVPSGATVEAVTFSAGSTFAPSRRKDVRRASGLSTQVDLRLSVAGGLSLSLGLGYERYTIDQDSALQKWNWIFWNDRYAGLVQSIVRGPDSSIIRASLVPNQRMQAFPITLALSYPLVLNEDLSIIPSVGGGVIFYTRKLYLQETWSRYFASVDHTYGYSFEQFSNPKEGNPLFAMAALDVSVRVSELLRIRAGGRLTQIIATEGWMGYDEMPFGRSVTGRIALEFLY